METIWTILIILVILFIISLISLFFAERRLKRPRKKVKKVATIKQQLNEIKNTTKATDVYKPFARYEPTPMDIAMAKYKAKERGYKKKVEYKEEWKRKRDKGIH